MLSKKPWRARGPGTIIFDIFSYISNKLAYLQLITVFVIEAVLPSHEQDYLNVFSENLFRFFSENLKTYV